MGKKGMKPGPVKPQVGLPRLFPSREQFRISALNDATSSDDDPQKGQLTKTKEAKEAEAFSAYTKALSYQQRDNTLHAEKLLRNLFDHPLLREASELVDGKNQIQIQNHQGLQLLYSIHKNLAAILLQRNELQEAMAAYIKAVQIDSSEVTVWFKMGQVARKLHNYPLAKICFQQALQCNPNHWPSLDNAISVTFALGDYLTCLENISTALEKDCGYLRGLALRKQILTEQPSLESLTEELFAYCDPRIHTIIIDQQESKEFLDEALQIRAKRRQLALEEQEKELKHLAFLKPLTPFTWQNVGEQLISMYDFATTSDPPKSLGLEVDLRDYFFLDQSVFLGETEADGNTGNKSRQTQRGGARKVVLEKVRDTPTGVAGSEKTSAFQRAQEQAAATGSVLQSLNIGDNVKESALLRRIQGHGVQGEVHSTDALDVESKKTTMEDNGPPQLAKDAIPPEQDLEEMDVSDALAMPLLREEEMNMAVSDIRKLDLKPELLLKGHDEEIEIPEVKSLENVLSSVIDMEFGQGLDQYNDSKNLPEEPSSGKSEIKVLSSVLGNSNSGVSVKAVPSSENGHPTGAIAVAEKSSPGERYRTVGEELKRSPVLAQMISSTQSPSTSLKLDLSTASNTSQSVSLMQTSNEASERSARDSMSPKPAKDLPQTSPDPSCLLPSSFPSTAPILHSISSIMVTHPSQTLSPQTQAHLSPPPAHSSPALTSQQVQRSPTETPQQAHISPPQTQQGCILPTPAFTISAPIQEHNMLPTPTQAPLPAHITPAQTTVAHASLLKACSPPRAHMTPAHSHTSLSSLPAVTLTETSAITSPSYAISTTVKNPTEPFKEQQYSTLSIQPGEEPIHSPIAASLLSPTSCGPCPKSASVYHSVLSSIEQTEADARFKKAIQPGEPLEINPTTKSRGPAEFSHREGRPFLPKESNLQVLQPSGQTHEKRSTGDLIEDIVRSHLMKETHVDKSHASQSIRAPQSSPLSHLSPHKSSPVHAHTFQEPTTQTSNRSPQGQPGLVLPPLTPHSHSSARLSQHLHHSSSSPSLLPLSPSEMPTYLPGRYPSSGLEAYRSRSSSLSLPTCHLNTLSTLEAESLLQASSDKQFFLPEWTRDKAISHHSSYTARKRPPTLSRSSSLPGYYTQHTDLTLPTYLSPPPLPPSPISPFFPTGRKSTQHSVSHLTSLSSLHPSSASAFPPYLYPPHPQDVSPLTFTGGLCPSHIPGVSPPHSQFLSTTTTPSPPSTRLPKYSESYLHHHGTLKLPKSSSSQRSIHQPNPKESKTFKPSSSTSSSSSTHHHHPHQHNYHTSKSPSHSSAQLQQHRQHSPKHPHGTTQSKELVSMPQTSPVAASEIAYQAISGDHSYQKRGILFQAMVESMLASSGNPSVRPTAGSNLPASTVGSTRLDKGSNKASDVNRKVTQATGGSKRGPKRKLEPAVADDWTSSYKRRSTRSRSTRNKREEKSIDYQELMKKYFPSSLLHLEEDANVVKSSETEMEVVSERETTGQNSSEVSFLRTLKDTETEDVKNYIKHCLKKHGILDMIYKYLLHLARKFDHLWYEGITDIFLKLYDRLRKHLTIPTIFCGDDDTFIPEGLKDYATVILATEELSTDQAISKNGSKSYVSPSKVKQTDTDATNFFGEFYKENMRFLSALTGRDDALGSSLGEFCVRVYWLKARQHHLLNETIDAMDCFEIVLELLTDMEKETNQDVAFVLPNLKENRRISMSQAKCQMENLQRCRSLEDVQKLYDEGHYSKVVEHLTSTFSEKPSMSVKAMSQRERPSQLLLLLDSLYNIKKITECMQWAEVFLHEAVLHYKRVPTLQLHQDWATTLVSLFEIIDRIMNEDENILKSLSHRNLVRMSHNLVSVIELCLDVGDNVTEMPIGSVLPWKILYHVLKFEEIQSEKEKGEKMSVDNQEKDQTEAGEDESEDEMSRPLTMLVESHEYLGRHSWCTRDSGLLLLFTVSELEKAVKGKGEEFQEEVAPVFEQCFYCLYGHPNRKGKARHLSDHSAAPVPLTWERAGPVFHHFAPHSVPEFDSYRTNAISPDVENLLRRISELVPDQLKPGPSMVTDYIEGISSSAPTQPGITVNKKNDPHGICSLLYYLLGDFYFKSKEPVKAVKFYLQDVVLNCNRLDSWAGIALAKMSQIEQRLNSTDLKIEKPLKVSEAALRCFRRAVELESGSRKLWLEYGSLAYQLHSHASRQIMYRDSISISEEILKVAVKRHQEMLQVAKFSYGKASECEGDGSEEDWLTHYMMGKVAEKQLDTPGVFLEHYKQAAICLYEERAPYPKKIQFVSIPPRFALEALEVFYRIQVSVLKLILSRKADDQLELLDKYVTESLQSPFVKAEEKPEKTAEEVREEPFLTPKPSEGSAQTKPRPVYHKNPLDHEYSRHKSTSDSQSEGEDTRSQQGQEGKVTASQSSGTDTPQEKSSENVSDKSTCVTDTSGEEEQAQSFVQGSTTQAIIDASKNDSKYYTDTEPGKAEVSTTAAPTTECADKTPAPQDVEVVQEMETEDQGNSALSGTLDPKSESVGNTCTSVVISTDGNRSDAPTTVAFNDSVQDNNLNAVSVSHGATSDPKAKVNTNVYEQQDQTESSGVKPLQPTQSPSAVDAGEISECPSEADNVKDGSQSDSQIESLEEEDGGFSCGNEADIDTDAMDVDEDEDVVFTQAGQSENDQMSQDSTTPRSEEITSSVELTTDDKIIHSDIEMMEVHTERTTLPLLDTGHAACPVEVARRESEGFTPSSAHDDEIASHKFAYTDSEDDHKEQKEGQSDVFRIVLHSEVSEKQDAEKTIQEVHMERQTDLDTENSTFPEQTKKSEVESDQLDQKPEDLKMKDIELDAVIDKSENDSVKDVEMTEVAVVMTETDQSFGKEDSVQAQSELKCSNVQALHSAASAVDGTGDFKNMSPTGQAGDVPQKNLDSDVKEGKEKWETEDKEKCIELTSSEDGGADQPHRPSEEKVTSNDDEKNDQTVRSSESVSNDTEVVESLKSSDEKMTICEEGENDQSLVSSEAKPASSDGQAQDQSLRSTEEKMTICEEGENDQSLVSSDAKPASSNGQAQDQSLRSTEEKMTSSKERGNDQTATCSEPASNDMEEPKSLKPSEEKVTSQQVGREDQQSSESSTHAAKTAPGSEMMELISSQEPQSTVSAAGEEGKNTAVTITAKDPFILRGEIIEKCMYGLHLCATRFPSHYKSLYRLADLYYTTKKLDKARDILLGRPDWQEQPHMPAPGLFSDKKLTNFFQGLWKIPIEDIDRSGCFASHVHRSVKLLLQVLTELGDLDMLRQIHNCLRRTPDQGKKYLRDGERMALAEEAFRRCVMVVLQEMEVSDHWSEGQREENLIRTFRVWNSKGKGYKHLETATDALHKAFKIMMKGKTDVNRLTADQAIKYCQQNLMKYLTPGVQGSEKSQSKNNSQSATEKVSGTEKTQSQSSAEKISNQPDAEPARSSSQLVPVLALERLDMEKLGISFGTSQPGGNSEESVVISSSGTKPTSSLVTSTPKEEQEADAGSQQPVTQVTEGQVSSTAFSNTDTSKLPDTNIIQPKPDVVTTSSAVPTRMDQSSDTPGNITQTPQGPSTPLPSIPLASTASHVTAAEDDKSEDVIVISDAE